MPVTFARVLAGSVMKTLYDDMTAARVTRKSVGLQVREREGGTRKSE